jgi:hypothetical protein
VLGPGRGPRSFRESFKIRAYIDARLRARLHLQGTYTEVPARLSSAFEHCKVALGLLDNAVHGCYRPVSCAQLS